MALTWAEGAILERLTECRELLTELDHPDLVRFIEDLDDLQRQIREAAEKRGKRNLAATSRAPPPRGSFRPPSLP